VKSGLQSQTTTWDGNLKHKIQAAFPKEELDQTSLKLFIDIHDSGAVMTSS